MWGCQQSAQVKWKGNNYPKASGCSDQINHKDLKEKRVFRLFVSKIDSATRPCPLSGYCWNSFVFGGTFSVDGWEHDSTDHHKYKNRNQLTGPTWIRKIDGMFAEENWTCLWNKVNGFEKNRVLSLEKIHDYDTPNSSTCTVVGIHLNKSYSHRNHFILRSMKLSSKHNGKKYGKILSRFPKKIDQTKVR